MLFRSLQEQYAGSEQGKLAEQAPRPKGNKIEKYYLPSGHAGTWDNMRGGRNIGDYIQDGDPNAMQEAGGQPVDELGNRLMYDSPESSQYLEEQESEGETEAEQIAQHITKGWGFDDWYDTEDARKDAEDIRKNLEISKQLLKLDPNDAYALSIRAYYE